MRPRDTAEQQASHAHAPVSGVIPRLDAHQRRNRPLGFVLGVVYKFFEDAGMHLVATMAYYALVAAYPMAVVVAAVASGLVTAIPSLQTPLASSLLGRLPVIGPEIAGTGSLPGGGWGLALSLAVAAYGGLGVGNAMQHAMNQVWSVPRNARPNPVRTRLISAAILGLLIVSVVGSSLMAGLTNRPPSGDAAGELRGAGILAVNMLIVVTAMRLATAGATRVGDVLPGAMIVGLLWPMFQATAMSTITAADTSTAKGVALVILSTVALLHLGAIVLVLCAELNVVLARRLFPRALLTPFTDKVDLTEADRQSYAAQARSQRFKAYQQIEVEFTDPAHRQ